MGLPKVLYERLRSTKGTRIYYLRNYYTLGFLAIGTALGYAIRESKLFVEFRREHKEGLYDDTPEFEQRKLLFRTVGLPVSSKQLEEEKEITRTIIPAETTIKNYI